MLESSFTEICAFCVIPENFDKSPISKIAYIEFINTNPKLGFIDNPLQYL